MILTFDGIPLCFFGEFGGELFSYLRFFERFLLKWLESITIFKRSRENLSKYFVNKPQQTMKVLSYRCENKQSNTAQKTAVNRQMELNFQTETFFGRENQAEQNLELPLLRWRTLMRRWCNAVSIKCI